MDLASAVQFLLAYEASLKLAPGQKPPPPSPSLFTQLSDAIVAIKKALTSIERGMRLSRLPPSIWSDWPLCCGLDLTPNEVKAARSLSPSLLRDRGLLSLFLSLHSCAEGKIDGAAVLAPIVLTMLVQLYSEEANAAPFPSAHLAARVGHRLINADGTLDFGVKPQADDLFENVCSYVRASILHTAGDVSKVLSVVPHDAAGFSLAKEAAVILDALSAAERCCVEAEMACGPGRANYLPLLWCIQLVFSLNVVLMSYGAERPAGRSFHFQSEIYREAAALPSYDPVLLLQSVGRSMNLQGGPGPISSNDWSKICISEAWQSLTYREPVGKLRPVDGYTAMRLGLEVLERQCSWSILPIRFAVHALQSGLVRPELILRARPQLLEGLVEGLAKNRIQGEGVREVAPILVSLLTHSPAVGFHLRKFFSRSGCLQAAREASASDGLRRELIRLLGPRAAQSCIRPTLVDGEYLLQAIAVARNDRSGEAAPALICDSLTRDISENILREPSHARAILQYLSELAEEVATPEHPQAQYGVLMVVGLGKACLALSKSILSVVSTIQDVSKPVAKQAGVKRSGAHDVSNADFLRVCLQPFRVQCNEMQRELSLLRRRVLRELLPLAEAREAVLWEGVREEEVAAALTEGV